MPSDNDYFDIGDDGKPVVVPCTCLNSCSSACKGTRCKCKACNMHWQDFLSARDE